MQSGISVSHELRTAFNDLVSTPSQRGLLVTIKSESLHPSHPIPSTTASFHSDLASLPPLLSTTQAAYILLRRHDNAPDGYLAITYVPDAAPVRQKTLYASTRLTLVRELGQERFGESVFVTEVDELTRDGWERHEAHGRLEAPLTEEEETLRGVREAEAEARGGTEGRRLDTGGRLTMRVTGEARSALEGLRQGGAGLLVQLNIDMKTEMIGLVSTSSTDVNGLASAISNSEPRYSFFKYTHTFDGPEKCPLIFIYTCPPQSKVKERMVYATSRRGVLAGATADIGLEVAKKFEVSSPEEITAATLEEEFRPQPQEKRAFSRPKPPGNAKVARG